MNMHDDLDDIQYRLTMEVKIRKISAEQLQKFEGYDGGPKLLRVFDTECRGEPDCRISQVLEGPIPFFALCEHHALSFYGKAAGEACWVL